MVYYHLFEIKDKVCLIYIFKYLKKREIPKDIGGQLKAKNARICM